MSERANDEAAHRPVLRDEVVNWLRAEEGGRFVDCTLGLGGHSQAILEASPAALVIGIDLDPEALDRARERLAGFGSRFEAVHGNFKELDRMIGNLAIGNIKGVVADLGVSSLQLDSAERGFSFQHDAALDMRMDRTTGSTAADLLDESSEEELADLIYHLGEEPKARRIARAIVRERARQRITGTRQLADLVVRATNIPGRWRIHPATRTFQALRIAVNAELEGLGAFVSKAVSLLDPGGRLAVISFHSLEDRIIKWNMRREAGHCICSELRQRGREFSLETTGSVEQTDYACERCRATRRVQILTKKPLRPSAEEVSHNPRARSAKMRVCERIAPILA